MTEKTASPESLCERSDPLSGEAVVEATRNAVMRQVVKDIHEKVITLNSLIREASHYGIYSNIDVSHADTIGALARGNIITIECSKVIK